MVKNSDIPKQSLVAKVKGKRSVGRPRREYYRLQPSEMLEVVADRDVWQLNLELLPPQPSRT